MKKRAWFLILIAIGIVFILSSIPSLRVLPVIKQIFKLTSGVDFGFVKLANWIAAKMPQLSKLPIASKLPFNLGELNPAKEIGQDIYTYAMNNPVIIEFFLRKLAHIFVFFWITVFLFILLNQYITHRWLSVILANIGGILLAFLDEYRQTFVSGRVGSMVDVLIDSLGVFLAAGIIIFSFFITRTAKKKEVDKIEPKKEVIVEENET